MGVLLSEFLDQFGFDHCAVGLCSGVVSQTLPELYQVVKKPAPDLRPENCLEYAVIHELSHLRHRTHGRDFLGLVGIILPGWEPRVE